LKLAYVTRKENPLSKTHSLTIYFPSKDRDGRPLPIFQSIQCWQAIIHTMIDFFGGCTEVKGRGFWKEDYSSPLIEEEVSLITSFMTEVELDEHLETMKIMLSEAMLMLNQASWSYVIDQTMYLI
jgi:hypothetical protein